MMTRCTKCRQLIEARDLVEEENPDDPFEPFYFHTWCAPGSEQETPQEN
ncbi:MAG TPA: hypothetical protein VF747_11880 [Blastocatellia bacterium]|jgi:hypothetical protein